MGNCQAAEAATVVIQHPGNKVERIYWSVSAHEIMDANPGHYVALVVAPSTVQAENGKLPVKHQLKLLRPQDTLLLGHAYRLVSVEDVFREFSAKKCAKLGKLLKERGGLRVELRRKASGGSNPNPNPIPKPVSSSSTKMGEEVHRPESNVVGSSNQRRGRHRGSGGGQWKPALQSISEMGT